ncbi:MAG: phosphorylase [Gemmatimonadota bacterium]
MTTPGNPRPGSLLERMAQCRERALGRGALQPIATRCHIVEDGGIPFGVRVLSTAAREAEARYQRRRARGVPSANPFLPYDPDLYVGDAGDAHVCLLNKFNVVEDHLLVVTRQFEAQESRLALADFAAVWACLWEADGLAFYNSGVVAGASQPHKHLQLVLGSLCPGEPGLPIAGACQAAPPGATNLASLPFDHAWQPLPAAASPAAAAAAGFAAYGDLLARLGLVPAGGQPAPYNLLFTRQWMLLVPRSRECYHSISVNALGFAGALLVRDAAELELVTAAGPLAVLGHVARPRGA